MTSAVGILIQHYKLPGILWTSLIHPWSSLKSQIFRAKKSAMNKYDSVMNRILTSSPQYKKFWLLNLRTGQIYKLKKTTFRVFWQCWIDRASMDQNVFLTTRTAILMTILCVFVSYDYVIILKFSLTREGMKVIQKKSALHRRCSALKTQNFGGKKISVEHHSLIQIWFSLK